MKALNLKTVEETLNIFAADYVEVRLLKTNKGTISGYYDYEHFDKLAKDIKQYDGKYNIFFALNAVDERIVARSLNKLTQWAKNTTKDSEIILRNWILIDLDPKRPAGVSSSDEELKEAEKLADTIEEYLYEQGFPYIIRAMSGNGYHLLLSIELPNDSETTELIRRFLAVLDLAFSNEKVKVDIANYNAARITKLYGTLACKGGNTKECPHRRSYIVDTDIPEEITIVTKEQLQNIIELLEPETENKPAQTTVSVSNTSSSQRQYSKINVKEFCSSHGIEISHEKNLDTGGICYVLEQCPWNPEHTDKSAYIIEFPNGKIIAGCHHDSCHEETWETLLTKYNITICKEHHTKALENTEGMSIAEIIFAEIQQLGHKLYHDKNGTAYVSVVNEKGFKQFMAVSDKSYRQLIRIMYYKKYKKPIGKEILSQVFDTLEAEAICNGEEIETSCRCKYKDGSIYYHLADEEQTVLKIDENGIEVLENSPIPFVCKPKMLAQVMPTDIKVLEGEKKTNFDALIQRYWKFESEDDYLLHNVTLLTRFISDIPSPILYYMGDRGSAKTTSMKLDKMLVDPSLIDVKALPHQVGDVVTALGDYMVCFDNVEGNLTAETANLFCICATSGYYTKRKLFTDNETADIKLGTKLSFSGITAISNRADFLDRVVTIFCHRLSDSERRTEAEIVDDFQKMLPYLLYQTFNILAKAVGIYKELNLTNLPRMADFAKWGYAIAEALKYGGDRFLEIYKRNQEELLDMLVEEDTTLSVLIDYMKTRSKFKGSITELQVELSEYAKERDMDTKNGFGGNANTFSRKLFQNQSVLGQYGIYLQRKKTNGKRYIEILNEKFFTSE